MSERITVSERPRTDHLLHVGASGKAVAVLLGDALLQFFNSQLIAVRHAGYVYFPEPRSGAEQRLINSIEPELAHVRLAAREFDFIVGAALSTAGLPLTRLEKENPNV